MTGRVSHVAIQKLLAESASGTQHPRQHHGMSVSNPELPPTIVHFIEARCFRQLLGGTSNNRIHVGAISLHASPHGSVHVPWVSSCDSSMP